MTLKERYFNWLCDIVHDKRHSDYKKLLKCLSELEFTYVIPLDGNRQADGIDLRYRFGYEYDIPDPEIARCLDVTQCSVMEMMVALALKMENIMDDPDIGNQVADWFWGMIRDLGLDDMTDKYFDIRFVKDTVTAFLNRDKGGLFALRNKNLKDVEIWVQAMWYLDEVISERR